MKSYIIKIEIEESDPLIWRKVVMPEGATFNRLHDVIQNVTNFQSGYPMKDYHLFKFDLFEVNKIVTNDNEAYLEHQHYKKNKSFYERRLKKVSSNQLEFEKTNQESLKIEVRKPAGLKIDDYLKKYKEIRYTYDFGDNWNFIIKLERIVDDYHFGFPTLLDGTHTAPPEDVGGIYGFNKFLEAFRDKNNPNHEDMKFWAKSLSFKEYDPILINIRLKAIAYKKTEWNKINHENFKVLKDKYRK